MPFSALMMRRFLNPSREGTWLSVLRTMEPPLPPLPPTGPPLGTNFSLLQATTPFPPLPARTVILTVSTNILILNYTHHDSKAGHWLRRHPHLCSWLHRACACTSPTSPTAAPAANLKRRHCHWPTLESLCVLKS